MGPVKFDPIDPIIKVIPIDISAERMGNASISLLQLFALLFEIPGQHR